MELLSVVPGFVNLQREDLSGDRLEELPGAQVNSGLLTAGWEQQLEMRSITNPLTKVYNQVRLVAALEAEIHRSRRYRAAFMVMTSGILF